MAARQRELLPTRYVHVVFTLPVQLAPLAQQNKKFIYGLLLRASAETLLEVARDPKHLLAALRQGVRRELLAEGRKHLNTRLLQQIPSIGPIRAVLLLALMQTPNRFRTKRQLWAYCGLALRTYTSGEYRFAGGQLKRSKKTLAIRGLNINHNHDLKNIFKSAATRAAATAGPFQNFYQACVANGMKPHLARLTLARKIAAITLFVWKRGVRFNAEHLKQQAA
jgi:hypothetical protein